MERETMTTMNQHLAEVERKRTDPINVALLESRMAKLDTFAGPRVGDWVRFGNGELRRFTYHWGDGLQTASGPGDVGSFYLGEHGCSYSGGLDPTVNVGTLELSTELRRGRVWVFDRNHAGAGRAVHYTPEFRVYDCTLEVAP
jgi:hypothetical protein